MRKRGDGCRPADKPKHTFGFPVVGAQTWVRAMAYTPDWLPLADALQRLMATGIGEAEAKTDLCRAMADKKIDVRVRIARTGKVFSDGNVGVPPHLSAGDFDWVRSRPVAQWSIGPRPGEHYVWLEGWKSHPPDLIELSTVDVIEILGVGEDKKKTPPTVAHQRQVRGSLHERLAGELKALYPQGRPAKAMEEIRRELEARPNVGNFGVRTLQRALGSAWPKA